MLSEIGYFFLYTNQTWSYFQLSPRGSDRLLKNLHLDLDALGGGLQYEVDSLSLSNSSANDVKLFKTLS